MRSQMFRILHFQHKRERHLQTYAIEIQLLQPVCPTPCSIWSGVYPSVKQVDVLIAKRGSNVAPNLRDNFRYIRSNGTLVSPRGPPPPLG